MGLSNFRCATDQQHSREQRTHQGEMCCGHTPCDTFDDGMRVYKGKMIGNAA